jgi:hypothetical protein
MDYRSKMNAPISKKAIFGLHKSDKTLNGIHAKLTVIPCPVFQRKVIISNADQIPLENVAKYWF